MGRKANWPPAVRQNKGRDRTYFGGRWHDLGPAGSDEARRKFGRLMALWSVDPTAVERDADAEIVAELLADYCDSPGLKNLDRARRACAIFGELYGPMAVAEFNGGHLYAFQHWLCEQVDDAGRKRWNRTYVATIVGVVRRAFRWGSIFGRVTPEQLILLAAVRPPDHEATRPPKIVGAAPDGALDAVLPHLHRPVDTILRVIAATGMRPSEVCRMRAVDLHRGIVDLPGVGRRDLGELWAYLPAKHKTQWRGKTKFVLLPASVRTMLEPFVTECVGDGYLFRPDMAYKAWKSKHEYYSSSAVLTALKRGLKRAGLPAFSPYQLRHKAARDVDSEFGREAAQAVLGHDSPHMTAHYTGRNFELAKRTAEAMD